MVNFGQCEIGRETEKAVQVNLGTGTGADRWQWFPRSVVEITPDREILVKGWFARKERLTPTQQRAF